MKVVGISFKNVFDADLMLPHLLRWLQYVFEDEKALHEASVCLYK